MYKAQQFFQLYSIPLNQRILFASYNMEDEALVFFQDAEDIGQFTSREAFVRSLHTRFGISTYNDPMKALTKLRQVSSMAQYKSVRDRAPGPFYDVGPNPREWVESCYCLSKWRFD